ncbi:hypothetical protein FACS189450_14290 [Spirochaetia bacterium]|nr:hypothetical protein FACS189450_14290 [Spirochaetia bacterium]
MDNDEVLLLGSGFCGLSGKKQAIILGMAKALVFTQAERGQTAKAPINALTGAYKRRPADLPRSAGKVAQ